MSLTPPMHLLRLFGVPLLGVVCVGVGLRLPLTAQSPSVLPPALAARCAVVSRACTLLTELTGADSATAAERDWAHARLQLAKRVVDEGPTDPVAWYTLAVADLVASHAGVIAGTGPLQVSGMTHEAAAGRALLQAVALDSGFVAAAEALARLPRPREGVSELRRVLPTLERYRGRLSGAAQLAVADKAREVGEWPEALRWLDAIAPGRVAPGVIALARTRVLYLLEQGDAARAAYQAGAADTSGAGQRAYRAAVALVATPEEMAVWDTLAVGARAGWLEVFWRGRDVREGWPMGTRLREHYRRVEEAWRRYRVTIPTTGRHQMAVQAMQGDFLADEELQRLYVEGQGTDDPVDAANYAQLSADKDLMGNGGLLRTFTGSLAELDDRGLVFIRQGEPDKIARTVGGEAIELWRYDRPEGPLLLTFRETSFDGQVGPSVLVATAMGMPVLQRQQLCHLDTRLCPADADPTSEYLKMGSGGTRGGTAHSYSDLTRYRSGVLLQEARAEGLAAIQTVTTTDAHPRPFDHALGTRAVFYGVESPRRAAPALVVGFAIPGDHLRGAPLTATDPRVGYRLRFVVEAVRQGDGQVVRLDTLRAFAAPHRLRAGEYLSGVLELPLPAGQYAVSLLTQDDQGGGAVVAFSRVVAPATTEPALSDLILGASGSGVRWVSGDEQVALHPLGAFRRGTDAELFTQVFAAPAGTAVPVRVEVWSADTTAAEPRLAIAFERRSTGAVTAIHQTVGLAQLEPGRYRLRLRATVAGRALMSEAWLTVVE